MALNVEIEMWARRADGGVKLFSARRTVDHETAICEVQVCDSRFFLDKQECTELRDALSAMLVLASNSDS